MTHFYQLKVIESFQIYGFISNLDLTDHCHYFHAVRQCYVQQTRPRSRGVCATGFCSSTWHQEQLPGEGAARDTKLKAK